MLWLKQPPAYPDPSDLLMENGKVTLDKSRWENKYHYDNHWIIQCNIVWPQQFTSFPQAEYSTPSPRPPKSQSIMASGQFSTSSSKSVQVQLWLPRSGFSSRLPLDLKTYEIKWHISPQEPNIHLWDKHRKLQRHSDSKQEASSLRNLFSLIPHFLRCIFNFLYCGSSNFAKFLLFLTKVSSLPSSSFQHFPQLPQSSHSQLLQACQVSFFKALPISAHCSVQVIAASHFWYQNLFQLLFLYNNIF